MRPTVPISGEEEAIANSWRTDSSGSNATSASSTADGATDTCPGRARRYSTA